MKKVISTLAFISLYISVVLAGQPSLLLEKDLIKLNSNGDIAALHFELATENTDSISAEMLIKGYQLACNAKEGKFSCIVYSMQLSPFPEGSIDLVKIKGLNLQSEITWAKTEGADVNHKTVFLEGLMKMD